MTTSLARVERKVNKFGDSHRFYTLPDGREVPSVTTVLGNSIPKPWMAGWASRVEREKCIEAAIKTYEQVLAKPEPPSVFDFKEGLNYILGKKRAHAGVLEKASEIGSEAHAWIEWSLRQEINLIVADEPPLSEASRTAVEAWKKWRESVRFTPVLMEHRWYSETHGYAGSVDALLAEMDIPGLGLIRAVTDFKTSKDVYLEHKLQVTAYCEAAIEMGVEQRPLHGLLVRLPKETGNDNFETHLVPASDQPRYFKAFLSALSLYKALEGLK
jgi:hypothetical protein